MSEILWIPFIIAFNSLCNVHFVLSFTHKILKPITDLANGTFADGYFCQKWEKVANFGNLIRSIVGGGLRVEIVHYKIETWAEIGQS